MKISEYARRYLRIVGPGGEIKEFTKAELEMLDKLEEARASGKVVIWARRRNKDRRLAHAALEAATVKIMQDIGREPELRPIDFRNAKVNPEIEKLKHLQYPMRPEDAFPGFIAGVDPVGPGESKVGIIAMKARRKGFNYPRSNSEEE